MAKKKRWFNKGIGSDLDAASLFPKSVAKHEKKLKEEGVPIESHYFDDDYSSTNWDLDKKLIDKNKSFANPAERYKATKSEYDQSYSDYHKTGVWRGYYRQPQLTYKYVQQMATALSFQHGVKVRVGTEWKIDLLTKTLTYNPTSLIYGTKAELLATLMHEIGKLRYVTHSSMLKNKYITMYKQPALEVLSAFEDLRTDYLMLKSYESAAEIYESIIPIIEAQVKLYMNYGDGFRELVKKVPEMVYNNIITKHLTGLQLKGSRNPVPDPKDPWLQAALLKSFGTSDMSKVEASLNNLKKEVDKNGSIYEYCAELLTVMYDLDDQGHRKFDNIKDKIDKTAPAIEPSKKVVNSQALADLLDTDVYPHIEDLLKDAHDKNETIQKSFPEMSEAQMKAMMEMLQKYMGGKNGTNKKGEVKGVGVDADGNMTSRFSAPSDSTVPPEWEKGDYKVLRDSVSMEIKQLINRLMYIRREELTIRYTTNQKRGKLNTKTLYKVRLGSKRVFKKKLENTDTVRSFAFSVILDVSGSMSGERIINCTRALIILAEVFKKMEVPFELITFSNGATVIKEFDTPMNGVLEKKIGGLVKAAGGGTNLNQGLNKTKIHKQTEKNKVVVILTDGGVGDMQQFDNDYFIPWRKKGIKSTGFGIDCEPEMKNMCEGNSKLLDNASELPVEFSNLLKALIKRR